MARKDPLDGIGEALDAMSPDDLRSVLGQLLAAGAALGERPAEPVPSRRRPQRIEAATYRVRIVLRDTKPPLWRRLELSSELFLNELHEIIQAAFGWTDSHLHQFGSGPRYYDQQTEYYLCPFQVEEGEPGVPEEQVRLDEVLAEVGDVLHYCYDFGDDWQHAIKLEAVLSRTPTSPRVVCTGGRRPGPPEDCGGPHIYELILKGATNSTLLSQVESSIALSPGRGKARWSADRHRPLRWCADSEGEGAWTPTRLAQHIISEAIGCRYKTDGDA